MQFSFVAVAAALVASVAAASNGTDVYITEVVTALTTVCPAATLLTYGGSTYTVTASTTLTITNCPCTISKLATVTPVVYCNTCTLKTSAPVYANTTVPAPTKAPTAVGTVAPTGTKTASFTAGANRAAAGSAAGLAGLLGLAAYIL